MISKIIYLALPCHEVSGMMSGFLQVDELHQHSHQVVLVVVIVVSRVVCRNVVVPLDDILLALCHYHSAAVVEVFLELAV
jgi:hypothetical protein